MEFKRPHILGKVCVIIRKLQTIEEMQRASFNFRPAPVQAGVVINEFKIDNKYRNEAKVHLDKILKPYEHVLDPEWKILKDDGIISQWVQVPNDGWEKGGVKKTILYLHGGGYFFFTKETYNSITSSLARIANAKVLVINYRLAPQNQFPAALHDALAAYLYLLNPPKDAGFEPLNLKNIVIAGDSAGGGLSLALGLAIRDARDTGLPSCAGIIGLIAGDDERLRDEAIYFAHRSAEPTKYKGPSYNAGKFEKSPFQTPTNTTFEIYEEMPHDFQFVDYVCTKISYDRIAKFIDRVTNTFNEPFPPSSYNFINLKGEFSPLKERHKKVFNWEKIGIPHEMN
ncbi:hypothetical protein RhiirC2_868184 [Rhizophagus irregularis]|uniref:Alpha/beta hydrolase fold-3 domain-containing protein n=1 Tax=Rhizophagus irregularis TaxID=588596 RepID=A0A2N1MYG0_9GLOM|nr:hypothetical protein RhiirC2_868184 [Rhizophagus irregularis]